MQHSSLVAFLSGVLTPQALSDEIASEVAAHSAQLRESKVGNIVVTLGPTFVMNKVAARRLLEAVAAQHLPPETAVYVADCIVGSKDIDIADEATREVLSFIEDDSGRFVDGRSEMWTHEQILRAFAMLD
jgi:hypothetical protein